MFTSIHPLRAQIVGAAASALKAELSCHHVLYSSPIQSYTVLYRKRTCTNLYHCSRYCADVKKA